MVDYRNSYGAVGLFDNVNPRTITFKARDNISGGYWVNGSSAQGVVSSGGDTYATSDIEGYPVATQVGSQVIGLAIANVASGAYGVAAMGGVYILPLLSGTAIGSLYAGQKVAAGSAGTIVPLTSGLAGLNPGAQIGFYDFGVGRALSEASCAAGTQYAIVSLNL